MKRIYFDNAATAPVRGEVFAVMELILREHYGNPSSVYKMAGDARRFIESAREKIAGVIGADKKEIYFTGCGTEANNQAILGAAEMLARKGKHIITQQTEHPAVLEVCRYLEKKKGYEITYLPVDEYGFINPAELENAVRKDAVLITIMAANNEIGTIQPVKEIGAIAKKHGVLFHTDAVQAVGHIPISVENIDLMTISAHKLYGPKGVGALYIRKGVNLPPLIHGGGQERGRRSGTENVAGIAAFGTAVELAYAEMETERVRVTKIRDRIIETILREIPHCRLNGAEGDGRLPGNVNISFEFIEGESILLMLDSKGISASSGSACSSGSLDPSHVLIAIGLSHEKAHGSLRISIGRYNTEEDADVLLRELPPIVQKLRDMSPLYADYINENIQK